MDMSKPELTFPSSTKIIIYGNDPQTRQEKPVNLCNHVELVWLKKKMYNLIGILM